MSRLVLASASPRRLDLLAQIGVCPDLVQPADIDETPEATEKPRIYAQRMGREKATAVHVADQYTLSGDTVVALGRRILPKAETDEEVKNCLQLLSGRAHLVLSAVYLIAPDGKRAERLSVTRVQMKRLSDSEIKAYLESKEGLGKAGGYAIQGLAGTFIRSISGSYTGVMGLPIYETAALLNGLGYRR